MDASCFVVFSWVIKDLKLGARQEKRRDGDLRQRAGQRLALGMEGGASPKLEETGMPGMMEVKVREAGCNGLGLLEFLHGAGFGLNSQGDLMILISRGKEC